MICSLFNQLICTIVFQKWILLTVTLLGTRMAATAVTVMNWNMEVMRRRQLQVKAGDAVSLLCLYWHILHDVSFTIWCYWWLGMLRWPEMCVPIFTSVLANKSSRNESQLQHRGGWQNSPMLIEKQVWLWACCLPAHWGCCMRSGSSDSRWEPESCLLCQAHKKLLPSNQDQLHAQRS